MMPQLLQQMQNPQTQQLMSNPCSPAADVRNDAPVASADAEPADSTVDEQPGGFGGNHADSARHGQAEGCGSRALSVNGTSFPAAKPCTQPCCCRLTWRACSSCSSCRFYNRECGSHACSRAWWSAQPGAVFAVHDTDDGTDAGGDP